jgi:mono/diheme cytochrome c family protein
MKGILKGIIISLASLALILAVNCDKGAEKETSSQETAMEGTSSKDEVQKGKELYEQNGCAGCHGEAGKGDGPAGQALNPKPRNFHDTSAYKQGTNFEDIVKTIETGIPGTAMVAYPHIPQSDRQLIAKFIVSLQN